MIKNGKDKGLSLSNRLPNVTSAMCDWFQNVTFIRIVKQIINFEVTEVEEPFNFRGVVQVAASQTLQKYPEGQRQWLHYTVHAEPSLILDPDERVIYQGVQYRVGQKRDYKEYGYVEYDLLQDFQR